MAEKRDDEWDEYEEIGWGKTCLDDTYDRLTT